MTTAALLVVVSAGTLSVARKLERQLRHEAVESRCQLRLRFVHHGCQQRVGKLPTNHRADLRYLFGWAEPVKTRH